VLAAMALGASGVWVGTRFLASAEAAVHSLYKEKLIAATADDTVYTTLFDRDWPNAPHRVLRNSTLALWESAGCPPSGQRPGENEVIAHAFDGKPVLRFGDTIPNLGVTGDWEALALFAGQGVGLFNKIRFAGDIVRELATGL